MHATLCPLWPAARGLCDVPCAGRSLCGASPPLGLLSLGALRVPCWRGTRVWRGRSQGRRRSPKPRLPSALWRWRAFPCACDDGRPLFRTRPTEGAGARAMVAKGRGRSETPLRDNMLQHGMPRDGALRDGMLGMIPSTAMSWMAVPLDAREAWEGRIINESTISHCVM